MENEINLSLDPVTQFVTVTDPTPTVSQLWDRAAQLAVVDAAPGPTVASRAYAITHTAMFDAWAQYDPAAIATTIGDELQQDAALNTDANKTVAMSWAAYTVLADLFPDQADLFLAVFDELDIDPDMGAIQPGSPADIGVRAGEAVKAARAADGANQGNGYADTTGYAPVNPNPLEIGDITAWTPENVPIEPEDDAPEQTFLTPHWGEVTPFGLETGAEFRPPAPEPFLAAGVTGELDIGTGLITLGDGEVVEVSRELIGEVINPGFIAQAERVIEASAGLTDEQKLIAEFWEDAGGTSFPPGTWMTFGQYASARNGNTLDDDAKLFFALGNAVMDAGIATWEAKVFYDYVRPVRAVRDLGELGLIGEAGTDALTGEDGVVIEAWAGPGEGTRTILAENWLTYQTPGLDPSPPFAEYTSGHSAFSAAGAQVLALFEGDEFGGAITFEAGESRFEPGTTPAEATTLEWATFSEAADEAGISRIYGGIHFDDGDLNGRQLGIDVGRAAFTEAFGYITGIADEAPATTDAPDEALGAGRLYATVLGRFPDKPGLNFWIDAAEAGVTDVDLAQFFLDSIEFERSYRHSDLGGPGAFVAALFRNLGIDAETSTLDDEAVASLDGGASRAEVVSSLADEREVVDATAFLNNLTEVDDGIWWFA